MANHKSAEKRARQSEERRLRNRARKSSMKTAIKKVEEAMTAKSVDTLPDLLRSAVSVIDKTASKGTIHSNNAARKISRLSRRVSAFMQQAQA